jgi:hypothetical protein
MSVSDIAYYGVFGEPLFKAVGLAAAAALASAASVPLLNRKGIAVPMRLHFRLAWTGLLLAAVHIGLVFFS